MTMETGSSLMGLGRKGGRKRCNNLTRKVRKGGKEPQSTNGGAETWGRGDILYGNRKIVGVLEKGEGDH